MTMYSSDVVSKIRSALAKSPDQEFSATAKELLGALGYKSDLLPNSQPTTVDDFIKRYPAQTPNTKTEESFRDSAKSIHIIFQFTEKEIAAQGSLFNEEGFDTGNARSFLFAAIELEAGRYARGSYASFAREINKRWQIPTVVLFRSSSGLLTLAFVHRRPHRRDPRRDVLGNVSLIREIKMSNVHRAHVDILAELSLADRLRWMNLHGQTRNFDGLLAAWLAALDTEELNRRFYRDLFSWFERAVKIARFPTNQPKTLSKEEHVIRLITRLLFVWFIKEKGLVAEELFVEQQVDDWLQDYSRSGDSYYRAVLQNLFFATLNTEIARRGFKSQSNAGHRDFSHFRFANEIADRDELLALFGRTPFINGGLFDCLDGEKAAGDGGYRIDCFTDNVAHRSNYSIPNALFFDPDYKHPGLITLFNYYKFTVEENTPAEHEVALDPELLGKVFENLLAAYNPETRDHARKQTGSYYTPRPVVDYMVDEALVASLSTTVAPEDGDVEFWKARLNYLLDYGDAFNDAEELFTPLESSSVVQAVADLKVLDPAVGSGAFPMGVLNKLTLALRRLDPDNTRWEKLQKKRAGNKAAAAFETADPRARDIELAEISDTFERYRDSDFGRKLYLIQNSIYGVDIQPVATQISKLRFFISLGIEQQPTDDREDNYGIRPLPNLETRFVAANTLVGLERPNQLSLVQTVAVTELQKKLQDNRERHFHATNRQQKLECRKADELLRQELDDTLRDADFPAADVNKVAQWDPYDQNASADWFDPEYMFGVTDGFDVAIGNPPYVQLQKNAGALAKQYKDAGYMAFARTGDVYQLFFERGGGLLRKGRGVLSYITSNSWLKAEYGKSLRRYFADRHTPLQLLELGKDVFENAIVDSSVLLLREGGQSSAFPAVDVERNPDRNFPPDESHWGQTKPNGEAPWSILTHTEQRVMDKMLAVGTPLKEWDIVIYRGITTGLNDAFIIDNQTKDALIADDPRSIDILKPVVRGRDIQRYQVKWEGLWLIATFPALGLSIDDYPAVKKHLLSYGKARLEQLGKRHADGTKSRKKTNNAWYEMQDTCSYHEQFTKEKLLWIELVNRGRFAYDNSGVYGEATTFLLTGKCIKYLCAVLNAKLIQWFVANVAPTSGTGTLRWKKVYIERLPIPRITGPRKHVLSDLIDRILMAKATGQNTDTLAAEAEIDDRVYWLYGLTPLEISAVENRP